MSKCYIVEGCDNSGKDAVISTICKLLPNQPHIIHCVGIKRDTPEESIRASRLYYSQMFDIVKYCINMLDVDVILNRSHIGDMVYPQIYRGCTEEQCSYIYELETLPIEDVNLIYVTANPDVLLKREDGLSQSNEDIIKIVNELHLFENAIKKSKYSPTTINTSFTTTDDLFDIIKEYIDANI